MDLLMRNGWIHDTHFPELDMSSLPEFMFLGIPAFSLEGVEMPLLSILA